MNWQSKIAAGIILVVCLPSANPQSGGTHTPSTASATIKSPDLRYSIGPLLHQDNFREGMAKWSAEQEQPGKLEAANGVLDIDMPAGLTLWFRQKLDGPIMISYDVTVVSAGGANDNVTDLNCFWMATDPAHPDDILAAHRTGKFSEYNSLLTYYVGQGGNGNKTTRFRRYVGDNVSRPILPQNDLSDPDKLLIPNREQHIRLVADGHLIQYFRDDVKIFEMIDPQPYTSGWFALRTVHNHMKVRNLRIYRLIPTAMPIASPSSN
jgi:Domain of unknown function (DUF6250)